MNKTEDYNLYLVKTHELKLMTEAEAAHLSLMEECDVYNVTEGLGMEPEKLCVESK